MKHARTFLGSVKVLTRMEFWSFQVLHALFGGLLTVGGAVGALAIGDGMQKSIADLDTRLAAIDARLESIKSTLVQFRVVQSNGVILGALASGDTVNPAYRDSFTKLMFVLRRGPAMSLLGELHPDDVKAFDKERDQLDRLQEAATAQNYTKQSWDDFLTFEMTHERDVMDLQDRFLTEKADLEGQRQHLQASVDTATTTGIIVQQIGFVVILLAGLIYQHARSGRAPEALAHEAI